MIKDISESLKEIKEEISKRKRCKSITKEGEQCKREAKIDGYCMHHL